MRRPLALDTTRGPLKVARDTWLIFQREMDLILHNPVALAFQLAQPLTYLIFFAPFLQAAMAGHGATSYADAYRIYVPGLFGAMGLFGGLYAGYFLLAAMRAGIIDRCRVTPLSRVGLLLGRTLRDVATIVLQAVIITIAALPFGLRVGVGYLLLAYLLLAVMAVLATAISYSVALWVGNESSLGSVVNTVGQPVALMAGVLIPLALAPLWIQNVAVWNPFAWVTSGLRALFNEQLTDPTVWQSMLIATVLMLATVAFTARQFGREIR